MFGSHKSKSCPLSDEMAKTREANVAATSELVASVNKALAGSQGTVAVFKAIDAPRRTIRQA